MAGREQHAQLERMCSCEPPFCKAPQAALEKLWLPVYSQRTSQPGCCLEGEDEEDAVELWLSTVLLELQLLLPLPVKSAVASFAPAAELLSYATRMKDLMCGMERPRPDTPLS